MADSLTEALDNLYTTTWANMKSTVADQIFDATPFWFFLKSKGKMETVEGGKFLAEPLQYSKNENIQWITKGGTVPLNDFEFLTEAIYDWRYLTASIVRFFVDDQKNRGKNQIINFMNAKLENTKTSLIQTLEDVLGGGSGASSNAIGGLQWLVPNDPTAVVAGDLVGGIDSSSSTYSWWRTQGSTVAADSTGYNFTTKSFATYGIPKMRTMLNLCGQNFTSDRPDIIVCGQTAYEFYEDFFDSKRQIIDTKLADAGFDTVSFKGIPMIWSPSIPTGSMYFLNTRFIKFVYDPYAFFDMTEWKAIPDQVNDRAAQIVTACAFVTNRRRCHGVMYNIDTK